MSPRRLVLALCAAHALVLFLCFASAPSGPDASGYFVQARLIATQGRSWLRQESPAQFVGVHWLETADGRLISRYPPGLPVLLAGVYRVFGSTAALMVVPILATLGVLLTFLLVRPLAGEWPALFAAGVLATNGVLNERALTFDAHTASLAVLLGGIVLLDRWARRREWITGLAAGLVLGLLPSIRYGETVCGIGAAAFLLVQWRRGRPIGQAAVAVAGAAVPIAALLAYQHAAFGSVTTTGYALTHEQGAFDLLYLRMHLLPYLRALLLHGPGVLLVLGLAGMLAMLADRDDRARGVLFLGVAAPLTLTYAAYYWPAGTPSLRFLLPSFPLYVAAAMWLLSRAWARLRPRWRALALALCAAQVAVGVAQSARVLTERRSALRAARAMWRWAQAHVPEGSAIAAPSTVQETLWYAGRWKLGDGDMLTGGPVPGDVPAIATDVPDPEQRRADEVRMRYALMEDSARERALLRELAVWAGPGHDTYWLAPSGHTVPGDLVPLGEVSTPDSWPGRSSGNPADSGPCLGRLLAYRYSDPRR